MLATLLPLLPLLVQVAPEVARWLGGDDAADAAETVGSVIQRVAGGTSEAEVAAALADPNKRAELTLELAKIAAAREKARDDALTARMQAMLADTANARATTVALANANSVIAYLAPCVCVVIFGLFGFVVIAEVFGYGQGLSEATRRLLDYLAIAAAGYSIGSSAGSAVKDSRIGQGLSAMHEALRGVGSSTTLPVASSPAAGDAAAPASAQPAGRRLFR